MRLQGAHIEEEEQSGEALDMEARHQHLLLRSVHLGKGDVIDDRIGKSFPSRLKLLAMSTPLQITQVMRGKREHRI